MRSNRRTWIRKSLTFRAALSFAVASVVAAAMPAAGATAGFNEFPTIGAEAMAYYEGDIDQWMDGPVEYLALKSEREVWKKLGTSADRVAFIRWFWDRRDDDSTTTKNPFKIAFYERVAAANDRFAQFPRGWRSDRGRVWVTLGRPDSMRGIFNGGGSGERWSYFTNGREHAFTNAYGEVQLGFALLRGEYRIVGGFGGAGVYPLYVRHAFDYTRRAAIVDPTLELNVKLSD